MMSKSLVAANFMLAVATAELAAATTKLTAVTNLNIEESTI